MNFTIVSRDSRYPGLTGEYDNPKVTAYQYMALCQSRGHHTSTTFHADGAITVDVAGLEPATFAPTSPALHGDGAR